MRVPHVALTGLLLLGLACASAPASMAGAADPAFGEPFTLKPGASVMVGAEKVTVGFERVSADSRCPRDVQCIQAGEATVLAWVQTRGGRREDVEVSTRPGQDSGAVGAYTLTLTSLLPVPLAARPPRASDYRATFTLTRTATQP